MLEWIKWMKVNKFFLANGDFYNGWAICREGYCVVEDFSKGGGKKQFGK